METPEFLLWAIEHRCPVRAQQDGSDPERTERQLRAARAVNDARREGRVFEGLCVLPPDGFRIDEALAVYGGQGEVARACGACPANAQAEGDPAAIVGCFGFLPLPAEARPFHAAIERGITERSRQVFDTSPRWYGLWLRSPLWAELLQDTWLILDAALADDLPCRSEMRELMNGLNAAFNAGARLHARLYPRGRVVGGRWLLAPHCPRCQAEWIGGAERRCAVCSYVGPPAPETKRLARGKRPYFPLDRLLGEQQAAEFLVRYEAFQARQASPDRVEDQPQRAPPDSPPAG
jgi:hypothetical protein